MSTSAFLVYKGKAELLIVCSAPAKDDEALHYEKRRLWRNIDDNVFTGDPRPELDAAWRELIEREFCLSSVYLCSFGLHGSCLFSLLDYMLKHSSAMTLKISAKELSHLHEDSIAFADGSGYIAEMAVYHELHCIKRIRRHFHLERYYPDMTAEERGKEEVHIGKLCSLLFVLFCFPISISTAALHISEFSDLAKAKLMWINLLPQKTTV